MAMGAELEEAEVALGTTVPGAVPVGPTGGATEGETEKLKLEPGMMGVPVGIGALKEMLENVTIRGMTELTQTRRQRRWWWQQLRPTKIQQTKR